MAPRKKSTEGTSVKKRAPRRSAARVPEEKTNTSSSPPVDSPQAAALGKPTPPASAEFPTKERERRIAERAYALFLQRGREHGHALEDWLRAERQVAEEERRRP